MPTRKEYEAFFNAHRDWDRKVVKRYAGSSWCIRSEIRSLRTKEYREHVETTHYYHEYHLLEVS